MTNYCECKERYFTYQVEGKPRCTKCKQRVRKYENS